MTADFRARMDDDLSTPAAIGVLFDAVTAANSAFDRSDGPLAELWPGAALEGFEAVGIVASRPAGRARRDSRPWRTSGTRLGRLGTGQQRTGCATTSSPAAYRVEDTPGGTRVYR